MTHRFLWSILGTGLVAHKFVVDLRQVEEAEVVAVASRDPDNARRFATEHGIPNALDYDNAIEAQADAVYIATPPSLHESQALAAIAAGKAVLIEKPVAPDAAAARRIMHAATEANVFCMEAMWTRFQPAIDTVLQQIESGALGALRGFDGHFMIANQPDPAASLFDPDRAGGALLHRGIYPVSLARLFLGPVTDIRTLAEIGGTGVDEDSSLMLRHEGGGISTIRASLRANGPEGAVLYGTKGTLYLDGPVYRPLGLRLVPTRPTRVASGQPAARKLEGFRESHTGLRLIRRLKRLIRRSDKSLPSAFRGNGYHYQARAVMEAVASGRTYTARMTMEESAEIIDLLDRARQDWEKP